MAKTLIAFFSRADENYFAGAMRYVKVGIDHAHHQIAYDLGVADLDVAHSAREIVFIRP